MIDLVINNKKTVVKMLRDFYFYLWILFVVFLEIECKLWGKFVGVDSGLYGGGTFGKDFENTFI
jgi:hypothetical protein